MSDGWFGGDPAMASQAWARFCSQLYNFLLKNKLKTAHARRGTVIAVHNRPGSQRSRKEST
jgi:hypothetical protein